MQDEIELGVLPIAIDISQELPVLLPDDITRSTLLESLSTCVESSGCVEVLVHEDDALKMYPLLVGLCLSYPVLYSYISSRSARVGNALSSELVKFIVFLAYSLFFTQLPINDEVTAHVAAVTNQWNRRVS